jgi:folylpolyglutamate synthase/dihydropteroate synthase
MELLGDTLEKIAWEKRGIVKGKAPLIVGPHAAPFFPEADAVSPPCYLYDAENSALAALALKRLGVSEEQSKDALATRPKCRFEKVGNTILDVAHNPDGFTRLDQALRFHFPDELFHFIVAFSQDKQWRQCLDIIRPLAQKISFVNSHPRFVELGGISMQEAMRQTGSQRRVICGSFYLMEEARRCLGIVEPRDPD